MRAGWTTHVNDPASLLPGARLHPRLPQRPASWAQIGHSQPPSPWHSRQSTRSSNSGSAQQHASSPQSWKSPSPSHVQHGIQAIFAIDRVSTHPASLAWSRRLSTTILSRFKSLNICAGCLVRRRSRLQDLKPIRVSVHRKSWPLIANSPVSAFTRRVPFGSASTSAVVRRFILASSILRPGCPQWAKAFRKIESDYAR